MCGEVDPNGLGKKLSGYQGKAVQAFSPFIYCTVFCVVVKIKYKQVNYQAENACEMLAANLK